MNRRILTWLIALVIVFASAGLLLWSYRAHRDEVAADAKGDAAIATPAKVAAENGDPTVTVDDDVQDRMNMKVAVIEPMTSRKQIVAYGALEEDPGGSFVLRAPLAGTIQSKSWPVTGQTIADDTIAGQIEPRLTPTDRVTLNDRLTSAQSDFEAERASVTSAQQALSRAKALNADDKNVSDRVVQEAEARVATELARLNGAQRSIQQLQAALGSPQSAAAPLGFTRGGVVVEVLAHPGESVESGQALIRIARFDKLLARVDIPAGESVAPDLTSATIVALGNDAKPLSGERIGFASSVDPKTQGQPFLFRVSDPTNALRPGLSVTAYLETPGPARKGAVVPRSAIVWQTGKSWAYIQTGKEKFARREVTLEEPASGGWFTESLHPGDKVVTSGAQMLLSEEFKSQIRVEDDQN